jgi:hypothetical protein
LAPGSVRSLAALLVCCFAVLFVWFGLVLIGFDDFPFSFRLAISFSHAAVDKIVPQLISNLESEDERERQRALNGLKQLLAVRAAIILPILIPKFVQPPMTSFSSKVR